jgi:hypothetical protein
MARRRRDLLERFSRLIEEEQAAITENVPKHSRHILELGERHPAPAACLSPGLG